MQVDLEPQRHVLRQAVAKHWRATHHRQSSQHCIASLSCSVQRRLLSGDGRCTWCGWPRSGTRHSCPPELDPSTIVVHQLPLIYADHHYHCFPPQALPSNQDNTRHRTYWQIWKIWATYSTRHSPKNCSSPGATTCWLRKNADFSFG
jgi:hypothetical protein